MQDNEQNGEWRTVRDRRLDAVRKEVDREENEQGKVRCVFAVVGLGFDELGIHNDSLASVMVTY